MFTIFIGIVMFHVGAYIALKGWYWFDWDKKNK